MSNEVQVTVRVPADVPDRADALAERMDGAAEFAAWRVTRSAVLRLAMLRGLEALEQEHGKGGAKRRD